MTSTEEKGFRIAVGIAFLVVTAFMISTSLKEDIGKYDYCVEWNGWINRDNMIFNCYDLQNNTQQCAWEVLDNEQLKVYHLEGLEFSPEYSIYNCSRYIKSVYK